MAFDAIVRISFQSNSEANQAANNALVGHPQRKTGSGPFKRVGTAVYSCYDAQELQVALALSQLGNVLGNFALYIDFVSITIVRKK